MKNSWCYDIEVFKNFFDVTFLNVSVPDQIKTFIISWDYKIDESAKLKEFLDHQVELLIGYNNLFFDYPILEFVYNYSESNINKDIYDLSHSIISSDRGENPGYRKNVKWPQMDLMKMMAFDKLGVSLKQCAINLKWHKIQDLPLPYDHKVERNEIELIVKYNINDVLITYELYKALQPQINLRKDLGELYEVDLKNASDSKIANVLLEKFYVEETGIDLKTLRQLRTKRTFLWLRECISPKIKFKTVKLQELKTEIANTLVVSENNFAYKKNLKFGNCSYELGIGGLHSEDNPCKFVTDDKFIIRDSDVASYYPNIIINNNIKPEHLDDKFINILKTITKERIEAKKSGNKTKADGLKITINSIFGKLGSETFWLQDAKAMLSTTVSGQLYLLMLIESLELSNISVISANTDGIVCKIDRNLEDKFYEICKQWQQDTNFELEYTDYELYIRQDVNNYITKKSNGNTKEKGRYLVDADLKKGYKYPVVPRCLYNYFINNVPVLDSLKSSTDILEFCLSQKTGKEFILEYRENEIIEKLQKTNRFYVSNSGGTLVKVHNKTGAEIGLCVGETTRILNDYESVKEISEYDIKYEYYEIETLKYIEEIEKGCFDIFSINEEISEVEDNNLELEIDKIDTTNTKIENPTFRYSKYAYIYDKENNTIYKGLASLKYITGGVARELQKFSNNYYSTFTDLLVDITENSTINSRQLEILIKINFFKEFGNNKKLLNIFVEFASGKNKYNKNLKQSTKDARKQLIIEYEKSLSNDILSVDEQIKFEVSTLGYVQTTYPDLDKKYCLIRDIQQKFSPMIDAMCLANGKTMTIKIQKGIFTRYPISNFDIIKCEMFSHKKAVDFVDGKFVESDAKPMVWWLEKYQVLKKEEIDMLLPLTKSEKCGII